MSNTYGTLYGVGVGPGDPDLMTLRAVKTLTRVPRIFAASSTKNDASVALGIASEHLQNNVEICKLGFPMTRDHEVLLKAWEENADKVESFLKTGKDAAFITLGDPLLYSTFGYLASTLGRKWPEMNVVAIPGITSFQAAASKTMSILAESGQSLHVISGVCTESELRNHLEYSENVVILKAYRNLPVIRKVLDDLELTERCLLASRVGQEGESIVPLQEAPAKPPYFSLILITSGDRAGS